MAMNTESKALLAALSCLLPCGAQTVQLCNGDFESPAPAAGCAPVGWYAEDPAAGVPVLETALVHSGKQALRLTKAAPGLGFAVKSRLYPALPGQTYTASAWVFNESGDGWLYLEFYSNETTRVAETHRGAGKAGSWEPITVEQVCPAEAKYVGALLYSSAANVGTSVWDDVAIAGPQAPGDVIAVDVRIAEEEGAMPTALGYDLGSRLELFVDDYLIETMAGTTLRLHEPRREEIAVTLDAPWEGDTSHYVTVFKDGDRYRMYYRGSVEVTTATTPVHEELCAYAESPDGRQWTKPNLGLYEFNGNRDNAIVYMGRARHNFTPFKDANPNAKPDELYKALGGGPLWALASPDGLRWHELSPEPVITQGAFDSQNLAFYDALRGLYVCYLRDFRKDVRTVRMCTSKDFLKWTTPRWLSYGDAPEEHLYTNAISPYFRAPHLYLGFPKRFVPERTLDTTHRYTGLSDGVFMSSRDGLNFRRWDEAFLRPGLDPENWTDRNNHIAYGIVPTGPAEISLYALEHYQHPTNRIRRLSLRPDGFVSVHADAKGGELVTKPFTFTGKELLLNLSTSVIGGVQVEVQQPDGQPVPGFALAACPVLFGDGLELLVGWAANPDLSRLQGQPIRLRFALKDADLYALRFRP
jgi:hypothetical protein